jgi:signal transduction histidine kinase
LSHGDTRTPQDGPGRAAGPAVADADVRVLQSFIHDLGNLLAPLTPNLDFVRDQLPPGANEDLLDALLDARETAYRLRLFKELAWSAIARGHGVLADPVPVAPALEQARALVERRLAQKRGVIVFEVDPTLQILGSPSELARVASAIADALVSRLPSGGRLGLAARRVGPTVAELAFSGTHTPIAPELRPHVFDAVGPARDAAHLQLGAQGLTFHAIALTVERMGGTIRLEDAPDWPTRLVAALPARGP